MDRRSVQGIILEIGSKISFSTGINFTEVKNTAVQGYHKDEKIVSVNSLSLEPSDLGCPFKKWFDENVPKTTIKIPKYLKTKSVLDRIWVLYFILTYILIMLNQKISLQ